MYGVAIVGASAIGCICAKECASLGLKTIVLEEDARPGKFGKCTAIVSKRGLDSLGINYKASVANEVFGADIHAGKAVLRVRTKQAVALVLDRQKFDEQCAAEAEKAGAKIVFNKKVDSLNLDSRFVVGADGASSTVARLAGFPEIPAKKFALGYEAEYEDCAIANERIVHVFLDNKNFPGLFGWLVPSGNGSARIGFATTKHDEAAKARKTIYENEIVVQALAGKPKKVREFHALVPLAARKQTQKGNFLLVGDAAGQTKATTGGGIVFGGLCAKVAAQSIANNTNYEKAWRAKYGGTLAGHAVLRGALDKSGFLVKGGIALGSALGFGALLERFGDMDFVVR